MRRTVHYSIFSSVRHPLAKYLAILLVALNTFSPCIVAAQEIADTLPTVDTATDSVALPSSTVEVAAPAETPTIPQTTAENSLTPEPIPAAETRNDLSTSQTPPDTKAKTATKTSSPQMAMMGAGAGNTSPTIPGPNVLTMQNIQPRVDGTTGALTFRIPLDIPRGRNGMQPDVALVYSSQNTQDGIAGYGWELSIPYITRISKTGSQGLYSSGAFSSSLDGELATISTTTPSTYRGRVDESRRTYSFTGNTWTVYDKDGTRYLFGASAQSQQAATTSPTAIYRWYLEEIRDTNDNFVRFTYSRDNNQLYPLQIIYTGNGVTDGVFTVDFSLVTRPDPIVDYRSGFRVTTASRISHITAKMNGSLMRQYSLAYATGNNTKRSLLQSIQVTGQNEQGQQLTLPPISFAYENTATPFVQQKSVVGQAWVPADINGNGINDVTVFYQSVYNNGLYSDITLDPQSGAAPTVTPPDFWATNSNEPDPRPAQERGVRFLDIDSDGKADVIRGYYNSTTGDTAKAIYLNTYATSTNSYTWTATSTGTSTLPAIDWDTNASIHHLTTGVFADINADGLPDFAQRVDGFISSTAYLGDGHAWTATSTLFTPVKTFPSTSPLEYNSQLFDINGDGLADWIYSEGGSTYVTLNNGTGWNSVPDAQWTIATSTLYSSGGTYYDRGIRFADINGDGLPDMLHSYTAVAGINSYSAPTPESTSYNTVHLNTGSGWATSTAYTLGTIVTPYVINQSFGGTLLHNEYADFGGNGQKPQDVMSAITYANGGSTNITYATSSSMIANRELPYSLLVVSSLTHHDGLGSSEPVAYSYAGGTQYRPYLLSDRKFAGFASTTMTTPAGIVTTYYHQHDGAQLALGEQSDGYALINHPYREDVLSSAGTILRKTLRAWSSIAHGAASFVATTREIVMDYASDGTHRDRATEYQYATTTDDLLRRTDYGEVMAGQDGSIVDFASDMRATTYEYASASGTNISTPSRITTAFQQVTQSGATTTPINVLVIGGGGGGGDVSGGGGGGGGGYQANAAYPVSVQSYPIVIGAGGTVGSNGATSTFATIMAKGGGYGGNNTDGGAGASGGGGYGKSGIDYTGGTGTQGYPGGAGISASQYQYGGGGGGGAAQAGANGNYVTSRGGKGGDGISNTISGVPTYYAGGGGGSGYSAFANGGLGGGGSGSISAGTPNTGGGGGSGFAGGSGVVVISYPTDSLVATGGIMTTIGANTVHTFTTSGTFTVSAIFNTSTTYPTTTDQKFYYDNLPLGSVNKGNRTREEMWKAGTSYASSTIGYNAYGLATSTTDRNGNRTTYAYDTYNLYPLSITNPASQTTQYSYNYSNGQVVQTTDPNGRLSKNIFDGLGRIIEEQQSDPAAPATLVTARTHTYTDNASAPSRVAHSRFLTATTSVDTYIYLDGLGRERQSRTQSNESSYTTIDKTYDTAGRLASQSLPYFSSGNSFTAPTTTASLFTSYLYDALGRTTTQTNAAGTTATTYSKWARVVSDANSHLKEFSSDAFGNLAQVIEHGAANYTTSYVYDALGNLTRISDALGNIRDFVYDGLSRRISATDLHAPNDSTYGTYTYTYDDAGNGVSQTDPKNQVINRTYDALGRILTEDFTGSAGIESTYTYDSCAYGIGRMCTASSTAAKVANTYDVLGRTITASTTIAGLPYISRTSYDRQGNVTSLTLPNATEVSYTYGTGGLVSAISRRSAGTTTPLMSASYQPTAQLAHALFGNNASTTYSYDILSRLTRIFTTGAATTTTYQLPVNAQVLVVGGGGGGGDTYMGESDSGGGGGGGGYQYNSAMSLSVGSYPVTIGLGGASSQNGTPSLFNGITALGGGHGSGQTAAAASGGSGGGVSRFGTPYSSPGMGTQGNAGGDNPGILQFSAAGGGGAAATGTPVTLSYTGSSGGAGTANNITGTTTYYAGGGGGGGVNVAGAGGVGGGGSGGTNANRSGQAGANGLGGGGGGATCYYCFAYYYGGKGGDGVVIVSYPTGLLTATGGTITSVGTSTIHTFTTSGTFTITATNNIATTTEPARVVDLSYTLDAVGNITSRLDRAFTLNTASQTTSYTYDALDRLLTASTTGSGGTPFMQTFTYDPLGSLTSMQTGASSLTYSYAQTGYANPHAATTIGGSANTYDANGNLITQGTKVFTWDYANRLVQSVASATTTYGYDHLGQRVFSKTASSTTVFPSKYFSVTAQTVASTTVATSTEYIYAGDTLIAYTEQAQVNGAATGTPATYYVHTDHLGSTNAISDQSGNVVQTLDYYPYGATRINSSSGGVDTKKKFVGMERDANGIDYAINRYYDNTRGQFLSEDPVFWEIGLTQDGWAILRDPQLQNSYSWGRDNPITQKDPNGRLIDTVADVGFIAYDLYQVGNAYLNGGNVREQLGYLGLDVAGAATPFATGFGMAARVANVASKAGDTASLISKNREAGIAFEQASGYAKNNERIPSLTDTAKYRIPDILDHAKKEVGDMKFVKYLTLSPQMKDLTSFAKQNNYSFTLVTGAATRISQPLANVLSQLQTTLKKLDAAISSLKSKP